MLHFSNAPLYNHFKNMFLHSKKQCGHPKSQV